MATNMFEKAKKNSPKKKTENHEIVNLPSLEKDLIQFSKIKIQMADLEAEKAILDISIREAGKDAMISLYKNKKSFPGTLKVVAGQMSFQFITSDRYKKIDEDRFNELVEEYDEDVVEENTRFSFNTAILMKHMEHISQLLMKSKKLSDEEKESLLESETSYTVKKGLIKELFSHTKKIDDIIEDIQPVFSIKSVQKD